MVEKYWINYEKGSDTIVLLSSGKIFHGSPKQEELQKFITQINHNKIPESLFSIPYSYIKEIQMWEGKTYLKILMGKDSKQHITINNKIRRQEIFDYFKNHIPNAEYLLDEYSAFKSAKKPLLAFLVMAVLFFINYASANELENGYGTVSIFIFNALAALGVQKVILIFSSILLFITGIIVVKMRNRPVVHTLKLN